MTARLFIAAAAFGLAGCSIPDLQCFFPGQHDCEPPEIVICENDADCEEPGQVCYIDGCGNPGENLAVEVVPQDGAGEAQDFPIAPGNLRPTQILDLFAASTVRGPIARSGPSGPEPYSGRVSLSLRGSSLVIPAIPRRYDTAVSQNASFNMLVGAGAYTLYARPDDPTIPPIAVNQLLISPGSQIDQAITFPGELDLLHISGRIVKTISRMDPVQATLDVQVLDEVTHDPLSQKQPVLTTGDFTVSANFPGDQRSTVLLQFTPKDASSAVPRKLFTIPITSATLVDPLELGEYGSPVAVTGKVIDPDGNPVKAARVSLGGQVSGGGFYQGPGSVTGSDGTFSLQTLAGDPGVPMQLFVAPPIDSAAGLTVANVTVPFTGGALSNIRCRSRVRVTGTLVRPETGNVAVGVKVTAEPVAAIDDEPLAGDVVRTVTDDQGHYELRLDPALYKLEMEPGGGLPRMSRYAAVRAEQDDQGVQRTVELPTFMLSNGRTVGGKVQMRTNTPEPGTPVPVPNATVRIFRITPIEGNPGSLLLAEGVSDSSGAFTLVIPTR